MRIDGSDVSVDWEQARLNGGNYCFHLESDGWLCGRADRWIGHHEPMSSVYHPFVKIGTIFADLEAARWARDLIANHAIRLEERIAELEKDRERLDWLERTDALTAKREYGFSVETGDVCGDDFNFHTGPDLRSALDAAMAAERQELES